jgi:hypothetical protein
VLGSSSGGAEWELQCTCTVLYCTVLYTISVRPNISRGITSFFSRDCKVINTIYFQLTILASSYPCPAVSIGREHHWVITPRLKYSLFQNYGPELAKGPN